MPKNCAVPKRILAVHAVTGKAVIYSSIAAAIRSNSTLDRPWMRSGINRALHGKNKVNGNLYAGWFFTELSENGIPPGAQLALDLYPATPNKLPRIIRNAPRVVVDA